MKRTHVKKLVLTAILISISIILSRFLGFYIGDTIRVSLGTLPIILAGAWLGPVAGLIVGGAADIIGATVFSGLGIYFPLTVGPMLTGLIAGLVAKLILKDGRLWRVAAVCVAAEAGGSLLYSSWALSQLYGTLYLVTLIGRLPVIACVCAVEIMLIYILNSRLGKKVLE